MELLKRGWLVLRRRWPVVMIATVGVLVAVSLVNASQRSEYTATAELFLRSPDVKTSTSAYQGDLFSRQRAQTYVSMMSSDELARLVIDRLGLTESASEMVEKVSGDIVKDTVLVTISVTDPDAQRAANIANTYGEVFGEYVATVENVGADPNMSPLVVIVKAATAEAAVEGGQSIWFLLAIGLIIALVVVAGLLWFLEKFDTKVRSRQQIEEVTGTAVIGAMPMARQLDAQSVIEAYKTAPAFAEAARRLSVNVDHTARQLGTPTDAPAVVVASAGRGDGKSVVSLALAVALADRGFRVGIVDADRYGEQPAEHASLASGGISVDGVTFVSLRDDGRALSEKSLRSAIGQLSSSNDLIVVDGPAFAEAAEAQMIAEVADAAVLVVRPGRTKAVALGRLKAAMDVLDTPVLGIAVNQAKETGTQQATYV